MEKVIYIIVSMSGKAFIHDANTFIWFEDGNIDKQIKNDARYFDTIGEAMKCAAEFNNDFGSTTWKVISYNIKKD